MGKKNNLARLKRNYPLLKALEKGSCSQRKLIVKKAGPELIKTICDICYNIKRGNISMQEENRKRLIRSKKVLRRLADKKIGLKTKQRELIQTGGFLAAVIPAISLVASLFGSLINK
jgi:hypothetical protein